MLLALSVLIGCGAESSALIPATAEANLSTPLVAVPSATPTATAMPTPTSTPVPPTATPVPTPEATATAAHAHTPAPLRSPTTSTAAASPTPGEPGAMVVEVRIVNFAFDPPVVIVPVGTTVVWVNVEGYHTVLSADFRLDSPPLENEGDRYAFTFEEAGIYDYICGIHPDMLGAVQVVP